MALKNRQDHFSQKSYQKRTENGDSMKNIENGHSRIMRLGRFFTGGYAILMGVLFVFTQTIKLVSPDASEEEMAKLPFGVFDWGYVWSDTLVAAPTLLVGGVLFLSRNLVAHNLGRILAFAGFTINLYAIIFFIIGLEAIGHPLDNDELWLNLIFTTLGVIAMIHIVIEVLKEHKNGP